MTTFNKGDKVKLNSGGPIMTVRWQGLKDSLEDEIVNCSWMNKGKKCEYDFYPATLTLLP